MIYGFDELNTLKTVKNNKSEKKSKNRSIPYKEYFSIMHLTDKQKKDREYFAEQLEDDLIMIMTLYDVSREYNALDDNFIVQELKSVYLKTTASFGVPIDDYVTDMALLFAMNFVRATREHLDDEWYTSNDRLKYNAENESNSVMNYKDFTEAKKKGFTKKIWWTEKDNRVRATHVPLEGEKIPIDDLFVVGEALMRYPKDYEYCTDDSEIIGCRCSISYSN